MEMNQIVFIGVLVLIYIFRHTVVGGVLWRLIQTFFLVLLAILLANFAKKEIKQWWNSDK
jgi:hypothetical protein